jgi:hypothetical protein
LNKDDTLQLYSNEKIDIQNNFKIEKNKQNEQIRKLNHQLEFAAVQKEFLIHFHVI